MISQTATVEQAPEATDALPQEQFVRQVEDHSLPAEKVLTEQQEEREPDEAPALFVP